MNVHGLICRWVVSRFTAASKVLGEETVGGQAQNGQGQGQSAGQEKRDGQKKRES